MRDVRPGVHVAMLPIVLHQRSLGWLRPVAAVLGVASLVSGGVALFTIDNAAGSLFLLTLGTVVLLASVLGRRIELESFEILGAKIKVREVVMSRLELAGVDVAEHRPAAMGEQALALQKLAGLHDLYEYIRSTEKASDRRTAALDEIAARMQAAGEEVPFDPAEVSAWFHQGNDALRVIALNLMLAQADCRDFLAVLKAISEPRSMFEQFYGLRLGSVMLPSLDELEQRLLTDALLRAQGRRRFRRDAPLMNLSTAMLARLD